MDNRVGIMQGRLSPRPPNGLQAFPWDRWQREFSVARDAGFDCIEWIFEAERAFENPIWTESGQRSIVREVSRTGVLVRSVCADYFMVHRLAGDRPAAVAHAVGVLKQLIVNAAFIGAERILLPLLETSAIDSPELEDQAVDSIRQCLPLAETHGVTLGLEMEVPGERYAAIIERLSSRRVRAYYDTGNSAATGVDIAEDVRPLLPVLEAVHVKDRELHGESRPLGKGVADLPGFFDVLSSAGFRGDFVLQSWFGDDYLYDTLRGLNYVKLQLSRAKREAA